MRNIFSIFRESAQSFEDQERGEIVVLLLYKHPFTIFLPLGTLLLAAAAPVVIFLIFYTAISSSAFFLLFLFLTSLYFSLLWLLAFRAITLYMLNNVIITDKRIIEREQNAFFDRKVSELHNYRIQDVSVYTRGFINTILKFGDVVVQTAASEKEFVFHQIPDPEEVKDTIMKVVAARHSGVKSPINTASAEQSRGVHNSPSA